MHRFQVVCLASPGKRIGELDIEREILAAVGADVELAIADTEDATLAATRDADGILHCGGRLTTRVIRGLERCRIIAHGGVGYDALDLAAATANGIVVTNVADYCVNEVADHALMFLLALTQRLPQLTAQVRAGGWQPQTEGVIRRLREQTVAVIGYGRIGSVFGRKVQALGMRVLAVDPFVVPETLVAAGAEPAPLEAALRQADVVSVHTPLTPITRHLFGRAQLDLMTPGAYFINTARGGIVDEPALIDALTAGRIAGAGLDVLEQEPPDPAHPLLAMDNVLVTPHAAYFSETSIVAVRRTMARQVAAVLGGRWPPFVVNPDVRAGALGAPPDADAARRGSRALPYTAISASTSSTSSSSVIARPACHAAANRASPNVARTRAS